MGVFDLLRSVLGFGDSGNSTDSTGTSVAVGTERNPNGEEADGTPDVGADERDHEPLDTDAGNAAAAAGTDAVSPWCPRARRRCVSHTVGRNFVNRFATPGWRNS